MNYLAHLFFSDPEPLAWAGSMMGDFLKGPLPEDAPPQLRRHLLLHRHIDSFAHHNRQFRLSCRRLAPRYRYGRGILIDVFYDHFLACRWREFSDTSLEEFSCRVYAGLNSCQQLLSPKLQQILPRMARDNWLLSYAEEPVVARVLQRLEQRLGGRLPLAMGVEDLQRERQALEGDFEAFMAAANEFARQWKVENKTPNKPFQR